MHPILGLVKVGTLRGSSSLASALNRALVETSLL